jgi:glycosyltransferase involved in cell wall biosynthesis
MDRFNFDPVLLIGPYLRQDDSNIGGATVSFQQLIVFFRSKKIRFTAADTQYYSGRLKHVTNIIYLTFFCLKKMRSHKTIFLNASDKGVIYFSPILLVLNIFFRKKLIIRPFGGHLADDLQKLSGIGNYLVKAVLKKVDLLFLQTKSLVTYFSDRGIACKQLPSSRPRAAKHDRLADRVFRKRFIYSGQLLESKGLEELIQVGLNLPPDMVLHLYGPISDEKYHFLENMPALYKGLFSPNQREKLFSQYDVLVLPTFYPGEGYPGVIIEAYAAGMPVITTDWKSIPEIVEDGKTGFIIPPQSSKALLEAMHKFSEKNYPSLSKSAFDYFVNHLESGLVGDRMLDHISNLFVDLTVSKSV